MATAEDIARRALDVARRLDDDISAEVTGHKNTDDTWDDEIIELQRELDQLRLSDFSPAGQARQFLLQAANLLAPHEAVSEALVDLDNACDEDGFDDQKACAILAGVIHDGLAHDDWPGRT